MATALWKFLSPACRSCLLIQPPEQPSQLCGSLPAQLVPKRQKLQSGQLLSGLSPEALLEKIPSTFQKNRCFGVASLFCSWMESFLFACFRCDGWFGEAGFPWSGTYNSLGWQPKQMLLADCYPCPGRLEPTGVSCPMF